MSKLTQLFETVKEENLTKTDLEKLHQSLVALFAGIHLETAELEKEEALYLDKFTEETDAARKRKWRATPSGQRLIELKHMSKATEKVLSSIKSRLYAIY